MDEFWFSLTLYVGYVTLRRVCSISCHPHPPRGSTVP